MLLGWQVIMIDHRPAQVINVVRFNSGCNAPRFSLLRPDDADHQTNSAADSHIVNASQPRR
jgi:hypothetical protein